MIARVEPEMRTKTQALADEVLDPYSESEHG